MEHGKIFYTPQIRKALRFATRVHEVDQKQKRKGKDIAYITHPFTVALILSQVQVSEDVVVAGILHDTVEDAHDTYPVTRETITVEFGENVAQLVDSVTEQDRDLPWAERKRIARESIKEMSQEQLLLKSADIIANMTELIDDYTDEGEEVFARFNAEKEMKLDSQKKLIREIIIMWPESPLNGDLEGIMMGIDEMS